MMQPLSGRDVRRVQKRLRLLEGELVSRAHADSTSRSSRARCRRPIPAPAARCPSPRSPACGWVTTVGDRISYAPRHYTDSSSALARRAPTVASGVNRPNSAHR